MSWSKGGSMQKDLRGAESRYAGLPGFESQRGNYSLMTSVSAPTRRRAGMLDTQPSRLTRYARVASEEGEKLRAP